MNEKKTIDIKDIINYCHCPMYQKFSSKDSLKNNVVSTIEKFDTDIHNAIYSYLTLMQSGEKVTVKHLNRAFATRWIGTDKTVNDILFVEPSSWRDTHEQKRKRGLQSLNKLHKYLSSDIFFPIAINKSYEVPVAKGLYLTGTIEFVRELMDGTIQLVDFKVDDKLHNKVYIEKDIEITAACYAFDKLYNKNIDSVVFYGLDKNKPIVTSRSGDDYKMLTKIAVNVYTCIKNNLYYPCPSDKCNNCLYKSICIDSLNYQSML